MPRKSATQVTQAVSHLLEAGYLKTPPVFYPVLLNNPPIPVPPRTPHARTVEDLPTAWQKRVEQSHAKAQGLFQEERRFTQKQLKSRMPSLQPKPIVYLADKVRRQFYADHPWEGFKPRHLVEKETLEKAQEPPIEVTDLTWWSTNPSPEDVVALTVHLHKHHQLSLTAAYFQVLSQYHALKAEREVAARYAVLEARAWGGSFATHAAERYQERFRSVPGSEQPSAMRAYEKMEKTLDTWEESARLASSNPNAGAMSGAVGKQKHRAVYLGGFTGGESYQDGARAIKAGNLDAFASVRRRDGKTAEQENQVDDIASLLSAPAIPAQSQPSRESQAILEDVAIKAGQSQS